MEQNHVRVISNLCGELANCKATKVEVQELVQRYRNLMATVARHNALAAWGWLDELDRLGEALSPHDHQHSVGSRLRARRSDTNDIHVPVHAIGS